MPGQSTREQTKELKSVVLWLKLVFVLVAFFSLVQTCAISSAIHQLSEIESRISGGGCDGSREAVEQRGRVASGS